MHFDASELRALIRQPLLILDLEGTVRDANGAAAQELSLERADLCGRAFSSMCTDPTAAAAYLRRCARTSGPTPGALRLGRPPRSFRCRGHRLSAAEGTSALALTLQPTEQPDQFVLLSQKIEELNLEIERRRAAEERARRAERKKDEFLAMLGHELRNPLAPITTALELMRLREPGAFERERNIIERQTRHLSGLVDDLLDVSRVARGKIELKRQPQELSLAIDRAVEMTAPLFEERAVRLEVSAPRRALVLHADHARVAQILSNLLQNAAKYTEPKGSVELQVEREGDAALIRVRDSGRGIEPALLPNVFEMFAQNEERGARSTGGLGLGLAIVKSLVELHGGAVSAHSEGAGTGSEFRVRLPGVVEPERAPAPETSRGPAEAEADGVRVLIVDDNADAAELLSTGLAARGYVPRTAQDGPSALRVVQNFQPDVALLDIGLPIMDGYELADRLRERPALRSVPLIAVTAYGQEKDQRRSRDLGFEAHVVKPVDLRALSNRILEALGKSG